MQVRSTHAKAISDIQRLVNRLAGSYLNLVLSHDGSPTMSYPDSSILTHLLVQVFGQSALAVSVC
jgi:hypothetical protein